MQRAPERPISVLCDAAAMWRFAHRVGLTTRLKALHRPRLAPFLRAAAADWCLIAAATSATLTLGWAMLPLALLVIGNRQRALGNLLHDASHWSMDSDRRRSTLVANLLFCWPLWISMPLYRRDHDITTTISVTSRDPISSMTRPGSARLALRVARSSSLAVHAQGTRPRPLGRMDAACLASWPPGGASC
jgi:hypothetical protein